MQVKCCELFLALFFPSRRWIENKTDFFFCAIACLDSFDLLQQCPARWCVYKHVCAHDEVHFFFRGLRRVLMKDDCFYFI